MSDLRQQNWPSASHLNCYCHFWRIFWSTATTFSHKLSVSWHFDSSILPSSCLVGSYVLETEATGALFRILKKKLKEFQLLPTQALMAFMTRMAENLHRCLVGLISEDCFHKTCNFLPIFKHPGREFTISCVTSQDRFGLRTSHWPCCMFTLLTVPITDQERTMWCQACLHLKYQKAKKLPGLHILHIRSNWRAVFTSKPVIASHRAARRFWVQFMEFVCSLCVWVGSVSSQRHAGSNTGSAADLWRTGTLSSRGRRGFFLYCCLPQKRNFGLTLMSSIIPYLYVMFYILHGLCCRQVK